MIERANAWRRRPPRRTCQLRLAIVATLILLAPVSAPAQEPSPEVREALQKGIAAARAQQWTLALQQLDVARDKAPMLPEVLFNLALANDRMGGRDIRALGWYRAYLAVAPNAGNREAVGARITALEEAARTTAHGLIDKAVAANKLLPTEDNRNGGLAEIARAQAEIGDIDSAFATIASSAPGTMGTYVYDGGYNLLAGVFAKLGDLASADKAVRKIIAVDKRDDAIDSIVKALIEQNRIADALAYAATINGGSYRIRSYLEIAEAQAKAKDQAGARRSLDIAVSARNGMPQKERTTWHAESIIESAVKINERDVATRELDLAVKAMNALPKDPRSVGDVANLMKAAISVNDLQTVKRLYAGINWTPDAIKYGNRPLVTYLMASAYAKTGQFAEARALEPKITDPFWRGQVGNDSGSRDADSKRSAQFKALLAQQKFSEAEAVVTRGLQTDALIQMQVELANALRKAGNVAAASRIVSMIAASVAKQPPAESIEARLSLAFAYRSAGDFTAAQHMLDAVATPAVMGLLQKDS